MVLKFKNRGVNDLKKVLIYGEDGSGKSTFAETYCKDNNLNPVVIDIDDTNYTNLPIVEVDLSSDIAAFRNLVKTIKEISVSDFDTIIFDGVTSFLEIITSKAKGIKKYSDRAERFSAILNELLSSGKNVIFIGQIDMKVIHNDEFQSPKPVVKINSIVNEKYLCKREKNTYTHEVEKYRVCDNQVDVPAPKKQVPKPQPKTEPEPEVSKPQATGKPPELISKCIDALTARGMNITSETVRTCLEGRFKNEDEYQECVEWLEKFSLEAL